MSKVKELLLQKPIFEKTVNELCKEYYSLNSRQWAEKRKLREKIAFVALGDYLRSLPPAQ